MSERIQQYLAAINKSQTVAFRNRSRPFWLFAAFVTTVFAFSLFILFLAPSKHPLPVLLELTIIPVIWVALTLYFVRHARRRPTIIALSLRGIEFQGNHLAWSDVAVVYITRGDLKMLSIVLKNGLKTKVSICGIGIKQNKIPVALPLLEYPNEFIVCIKRLIGDKYKGAVTLQQARELDQS